MATRKAKTPKTDSRFSPEVLSQRHGDVEGVTGQTKALGEAASSAPSANILTAPAQNQRTALQLRMLQQHKLEFEAHQNRVWEDTGRRPSLQKLLDEATAIMVYVLSQESGIPGEASLRGESLSECVIRRLTLRVKAKPGGK